MSVQEQLQSMSDLIQWILQNNEVFEVMQVKDKEQIRNVCETLLGSQRGSEAAQRELLTKRMRNHGIRYKYSKYIIQMYFNNLSKERRGESMNDYRTFSYTYEELKSRQ